MSKQEKDLRPKELLALVANGVRLEVLYLGKLSKCQVQKHFFQFNQNTSIKIFYKMCLNRLIHTVLL